MDSLMIFSMTSDLMKECSSETSPPNISLARSSCWIAKTRLVISMGSNPTYLTETWLFASGLAHGSLPVCIASVVALVSLWESRMGAGINSPSAPSMEFDSVVA